jgi:peptidoglycan/xylan/chitin deacetylase (PgdA/CDA1 family)
MIASLKLNSARIFSEFVNIAKFTDNNNFRILTYHSIGDNVPLDIRGLYNLNKNSFYNQIKYLHDNNYVVSPLSDFHNFSITFDDGFLNNLKIAMPILDKFDFPFTVFVTPYFIENNLNNLYLNREQLKELSLNKNVTIGAHGYNHKHLGLMNKSEVFKEVRDSKKWIEDLISKEVKHFSYPFGSYNQDSIKTLKDNLFSSACTVNFGSNNFESNLFELKRTDILSTDNLRDFKLKINGAWDWIEFRTKRHKL